jgi:trehalose synthase
MPVNEVRIRARQVSDSVDAMPEAQAKNMLARIARASASLRSRTVWHVNTTAQGGGVAEMLSPLVAYSRGAGIDTRWCVISGDPVFFEITKRIHNRLHGFNGDGNALDSAARRAYETTLSFNASTLRPLLNPGDIVILHDPQTAGLAPLLESTAVHIVWRCHIGMDFPNDVARETWAFLRPYIDAADQIVFSREEHIWRGIDRDRVTLVPPAIDHLTAKNQELCPNTVDAILEKSGILPIRRGVRPAFVRHDGTAGLVSRAAEMHGSRQLDPDIPIVCQISRWDSLKDPRGVLRGFIDHALPVHESQLVLAGPSVTAVADDPEQAAVLDDVMVAWRALSEYQRSRVAVVCLPMDDIEENAAIVNALQRRSDVIVQKSLAEGFGLTVAEAMWKGTPVVASRVGGIQDQIEHGVSGLLLQDPTDGASLGANIGLLLGDAILSKRIGNAARERVRDYFLMARHLLQDVEIWEELLASEWEAEEIQASN